mmetsp:Transcript_76498/g.147707  ORF Transcript_76498/g.147707 Transcript_76498/m.147707 type:complete len:224 (-) Transcript_76498:41-712(-)
MESTPGSGGTADMLGVFMLAAFSVTAVCALCCVGASWWQARARGRRSTEVVVIQRPNRPDTAARGAEEAAQATQAAEAAAQMQRSLFQVRRVTSTVFKVEELPTEEVQQGIANHLVQDELEVEEMSAPFSVVEVDDSIPQVLDDSGTIVSDEEIVCEVCCERTPQIVFLPCSHGGICRSCAEQIVKRSNRHCHTCRAAIEKVIIVEDPLRMCQGFKVRARRLL